MANRPAKKPAAVKPASSKTTARPKKTITTTGATVRARAAKPVVKTAAVAPVVTETKSTNVLTRRMPRTFSFGALIAEFLGVFALTLIYMSLQGQPIYVPVALVGLTLALAPLSGAHLNPALTIGLWTARHINGLRAVCYVIAQVLGAMLALVIANVVAAPTTDPVTGQTVAGAAFAAAALPTDDAGKWRLLGIEALGMLVLSFGFASAYIGRAVRSTLTKGFIIGLSYMAGLLIVVQAGQVLNPSIAFAIRAVQFELWSVAIFVLTPIVVAVLGVNLYKLLERDAQKSSADNDTNVAPIAS